MANHTNTLNFQRIIVEDYSVARIGNIFGNETELAGIRLEIGSEEGIIKLLDDSGRGIRYFLFGNGTDFSADRAVIKKSADDFTSLKSAITQQNNFIFETSHF